MSRHPSPETMRSLTIRTLRMAAVAFALVACDAGRMVGPGTTTLEPTSPSFALAAPGPAVVISQVYGGGGNSGATFTHDFVELLNRGSAAVSLAGWSLQYASATGSSWSVAPLSGTIQPGSYFLVQMAKGTGGTTALPTPDASGGLTLAAGAGKISLFSTTSMATGTCPTTALVDAVSFGTSTNCDGSKTTPALSNTTAAFRADGGCQYTNDQSVDFTTGAPAPRNSSSPRRTCASLAPAKPLASIVVSPAAPKVIVGNSQQFTAKGYDADGKEVALTPAWSSTAAGVMTIHASTGLAKGESIGEAEIVATAGSITGRATVSVVTLPPSSTAPARISEIHYDNDGTDVNEAVEIEAPAGSTLDGWKLELYTGSADTLYRTISLSGTFPASCEGRGAISIPVPGIQNGNLDGTEPDGIALIDAAGAVVEFLSYEGSFTAANGSAAGKVSTDIGLTEGSSTSASQSLQRVPDGPWTRGAASFGVVNRCATATGSATISVTANGPDTLVVGWQRRSFATLKDATGATVTGTTFSWSSADETVATVDQLGYVTARKPGTAVIRATAGSTTGTYSVAIIAYEPVKATYRDHVAFGAPQGADPANDVRVVHPGFVASYNPARGGPNWVSWNINKSTFGDADRCECFSPDMTANQGITDQDYVNGGYDRGHMVQSESRTSTHSENAATFLLTNILPQAANNNQGPWLGFENYTNDFARVSNKEVYVVAGGQYAASPTTLKGAGRVAIPDYTWKVAVVVASGKGLADVRTKADLEVIAIRIPNLLSTAPPKNNNWQPWITKVDSIEKWTGLDLLASLPNDIECAVEGTDCGASPAGTNIAVSPIDQTGAQTVDITFGTVTRAGVTTVQSSSTPPESAAPITGLFNVGASTLYYDIATTAEFDGLAEVCVTYPASAFTGAVEPALLHYENGAWADVTSSVHPERNEVCGKVASFSPFAVVARDRPPVATLKGSGLQGGMEGSTLEFEATASDPDGDPITYAWSIDGQAVGSSSSLSHRFADDGSFQLRLVVADALGAADTVTATIVIGNVAPTGTLTAPGSVVEGSSFTLSVTDADDASSADRAAGFTFAFDCGTGSFGPASGAASATCTTTDDESRAARVRITDKDGASSIATASVTVTNAAPAIAVLDGASIMRGEGYAAVGGFTDPGADRWTATVDYGDGSGTQALPLAGKSFSLSHSYSVAGTFTVTVTVTDDDGAATSRTATVTVASAAQAVATLSAQVTALETAGTLSSGEANSLNASLRASAASLQRDDPSAGNQLSAFINKVEATERSGRLDATTSAALQAFARRIIASIA